MKNIILTGFMFLVLGTTASAGMFNGGGRDHGRDNRGGRDNGRGGWDRGRDHGRDNRGGRDNGRGHGGGHGWRQWQSVGTSCGPYQPWGVSFQCPSLSPQGMNCGHVAPGTRCYGSSYWHGSFVCTDPHSGQNSYGSNVFNIYVCQ